MKRVFLFLIVLIILINILFIVPITRNLIIGGFHYTENVTKNILSNSNVENENSELRNQIEQLKIDNEKLKNENKVLDNENKNLKDELDLKIEDKFKIVRTDISHRDINSWGQSLKIDKGSEDGIVENNPVTKDGQMIGYISKVNKSTSEVTLLTTPNQIFNIPVKIVSDKKSYDAILSNFDTSEGKLKIKTIYSETGIEEGDKVYTNGYGKNQEANVYIGDIDEIEEHEGFNIDYYVDVNHKSLTYLDVIIDEK